MHVTKATKAREWASLIATNPTEAIERLKTVIEVQSDRLFVKPPKYNTSSFEDTVTEIGNFFDFDLEFALNEAEEIVKITSQRITETTENSPIRASHNGDFLLGKICYLAVRALKPISVMETGVASGVTSSFILSALDKNGLGHLHSIDLPPLGPQVEDYVGILVPKDLRERWTLHRGTSKKMMGGILKELGSLPMFVHDSLHTYRNILRELTDATPYLTDPAIVISDDIDENPAFEEWALASKPRFVTAIKEEAKPRLLGFAIKTNADSSNA